MGSRDLEKISIAPASRSFDPPERTNGCRPAGALLLGDAGLLYTFRAAGLIEVGARNRAIVGDFYRAGNSIAFAIRSVHYGTPLECGELCLMSKFSLTIPHLDFLSRWKLYRTPYSVA